MTHARFTLRTLLALLTGAAVIAMLGSPAYGGRAAAIGVTIAVGSVLATLLVHAFFYSVCMGFLKLLGAEDVVARTSRGGVQHSPSPRAAAASSPPTDGPAPAMP